MTRSSLQPVGIEADAVYPLQEFCDRMGWGRKAFVAARRRSLPARKESRRLYIVGDEAIAWFKSRSNTEAAK